MCYEFERWNWKSRAKQRDTHVAPPQSAPVKREEPKPASAKEPVREAKVEEKAPA